VKTNGIAHFVEVAQLMDLAAIPSRGDTLTFENGTGRAGVNATEIKAWSSPRAPDIYPAGVTVRRRWRPEGLGLRCRRVSCARRTQKCLMRRLHVEQSEPAKVVVVLADRKTRT
jgi:hypothetical protein